MDEPLVTNLTMYHAIHKHPTVRELYGKQLVSDQVLADQDVKDLEKDIQKTLQDAYDRVKEVPEAEHQEIVIPEVVLNGYPEIPTGVKEETLVKMNAELLWPMNFQHSKLEKS
jgi:2-oxoglutarate dehydrogenase E1 component